MYLNKWRLLLILSAIITAPMHTLAYACETQNVSNKMRKALSELSYRVRGGFDRDAIQVELDRLKTSANCFEAKLLKAVAIEADAFSRSPTLALPALTLLYKNTSPEDLRYTRILQALGKNYAFLDRPDLLEQLIAENRDAPDIIKSSWQLGLAMAYARTDDLLAAMTIMETEIERFRPSRTELKVAIAISELAGDRARAEMFTKKAEDVYGSLRWPRNPEGSSLSRFERMHRQLLHPAWSSVVPTKPPRPSYPRGALSRGLEGECDVWLDVSESGKPINIEALCSSSLFKRESERALSKVRFEPLIIDGEPQIRYDVVYPLEFNIG